MPSEDTGTPAGPASMARLDPAPELIGSLALVAILASGALLGLMIQGNWLKILRVGTASVVYLGVLLAELWSRTGLRTAANRLPYWPFGVAGGAAGAISGLIRPMPSLGLVSVQLVSAALLLGGVHWLSVRWWRRLRTHIAS
jgi:hypothetical protein